MSSPLVRRSERICSGETDLRRVRYIVPILVFLLSRVLLAVLAFLAPHLLSTVNTNQSVLPRTDPLAQAWNWSSPWFRFDAGWYVDVAVHGYHYGPNQTTNTNFFPLYPLLIRAIKPVTFGSAWISALLVANLSFLAALLLLWRWALLRWNEEIALRVVLLTVAFPFSFFFAAPYSEPLFLALAVGAFLAAELHRWPLASALAGLSAVARPMGIAVIVGLLVIALARRDGKAASFVSLAFLPFLGFVVYLGLATGHPLSFTANHSAGWVSPHGGVLNTVAEQFHTSLSPFDRVDAVVSVIFLVSSIVVWRRVGRAYAVFTLLGVLFPLTRGICCMERYVIVLFPAFAAWATWRSRGSQGTLFAVSLLGLVTATTMFAAGYSIF